MNDLKKSEIKSLLDENNIEYKSSAKKSDLIELLKTIYIEEEVFLSDIEEEQEEKPILEVKEVVKEEVKEKKAVKKWIDRYYWKNGVKHTYPRDRNSYYYVLE
tara:strand:- start:677 stop:985 length:309 start_codon:yes stop_codon:yes gene_type:complete